MSDPVAGRDGPDADAGDAGRFPRPLRAAGPVIGTLVTLGAWTAIARTSGSGWVQALGAVIAGFLLVGLVGPAWAARRARCAVVAGPSDGTTASPLSFDLRANRPLRITPVHPPGGPTVTGSGPDQTLVVVPRYRGELTQVDVEVASAAPFGLLWWSKRMTLRLPRPVLVAPRLGDPDPVTESDDRARGEDARPAESRVGQSRGVRGYVPGDLRNWVHWPATAHAGSLMVREMEQPADRPVTVEVTLPADPEAAEQAAGRALGTVAQLLGRGRRVVLVTQERSGTVSQTVDGVAQAGRRLAKAVPGGAPWA